MKHSKGAQAPFFLPVCAPRLRDDALLAGAVEAFQAGHLADALVAAEYVCRRHPSNTTPALLRAKIIEDGVPALAANAWYAAWYADPENTLLQDAMLNAWLRGGARHSVAELGAVFLPGRCQSGTHHSLIQLLQQTSHRYVGACWKAGEWVEGRLFDLQAQTRGTALQQATLILSDGASEFAYSVPPNGDCFRIQPPYPHGEWSLAFVPDPAEHNAQQRMQGSPLVFACVAEGGGVGLPHLPMSNALEPSLAERGVDIIIPVYQDLYGVQACITSVLASQRSNHTPSRVIVINDDSPESALVDWLAGLAQTGQIMLLTNRHNLGFIGASNRGLRHHSDNDALLLNADTLVHGDWIDRLHSALYSASDIASVMPWSNNAEVGSFPHIAVAAPAPDPGQLAQIDALAASLQAAGNIHDIEIPSCCGFAMLMRRSVIQHIGVLDGVELTRGYLEEVDWCMRARTAGYRHLLATGVFVAHAGSASFRAEKRLRVLQNRKVIMVRYPNYYFEYARFIKDDPIQKSRRAFLQALEQERSTWLVGALAVRGSAAVVARVVPAPLVSSCGRIAVWHHRLGAASASKVLALARLVASRPELKLRLLVLGEANEALWHTGVVDVVPAEGEKALTPLSDSALVGLSACAVVLAQDACGTPKGISLVALDKQFDPQTWLDEWLQHGGQQYSPIQSVKA